MMRRPRHYPGRLDLVQPPYREKPTTAIKLTEPVKSDPRYAKFIESVFAEYRAMVKR